MEKDQVNKIFASLSLVLFLFCACGCSNVERNEQGPVASVWKHEVGVYSVTVLEGNILVDKGFWNNSGWVHPKIVVDVHEGSNMWYKAHYLHNEFSGGGYDYVEIHIHGTDDIGGAGWNHGKHGSGTLERVE